MCRSCQRGGPTEEDAGSSQTAEAVADAWNTTEAVADAWSSQSTEAAAAWPSETQKEMWLAAKAEDDGPPGLGKPGAMLVALGALAGSAVTFSLIKVAQSRRRVVEPRPLFG